MKQNTKTFDSSGGVSEIFSNKRTIDRNKVFTRGRFLSIHLLFSIIIFFFFIFIFVNTLIISGRYTLHYVLFIEYSM